MHLSSLELVGFKSFGRKVELQFRTPITAIVGPNGSGKSNCAEAFRFVLGEQSLKSLRGKRGEDLIWGGSSEFARASRAAVRVTFDNRALNGTRLLGMDFDEVSIERTVYRDGQNEYAINNSKMRLKDVVELLAHANIGASGHHIISQGEADRVLAASPRERRQMIEDALGLRIYQYKKEESVRKLEKTEENKTHIESLRKENAPHLAFLKRQVERIAKARELREKLVGMYEAYLVREDLYIRTLRAHITDDTEGPERELHEVRTHIEARRGELAKRERSDPRAERLLALDSELTRAREESVRTLRIHSRLEGQLSAEERRLELERARHASEETRPVPFGEVKALAASLEDEITTLGDKDDKTERTALVESVLKRLRTFLSRFESSTKREPDTREQVRLTRELQEASKEVERADAALAALSRETEELRLALSKDKDRDRELERELFTLMSKANELEGVLRELTARATECDRLEEEMKREVAEAVAFVGREALRFKHTEGSLPPEERSVQLERKRELEKMKIRLEEMGGSNVDEITREYDATRERDEFLVRELADLEASATSLRAIIDELDRELAEKFRSGVSQISAQFSEFFSLMFGGGTASLSVVTAPKRTKGIVGLLTGSTEEGGEDEEERAEEGIDIDVTLPKKRVKGLTMLSGGERALTSIALIFAMSQVNPPPFLILDETDAALDEANSKRYGDMIENLSKKSQLILITHNRETMSRAGMLYGITMGADGVSKVLSVQLDEAVSVAK